MCSVLTNGVRGSFGINIIAEPGREIFAIPHHEFFIWHNIPVIKLSLVFDLKNAVYRVSGNKSL